MRVHTCRITRAVNSDQNKIHRANHNHRKRSGNNVSKSRQLKSRAIEINSSVEEVSEEPVNNNNININAINQNNDIGYQLITMLMILTILTNSISLFSINENSDTGMET